MLNSTPHRVRRYAHSVLLAIALTLTPPTQAGQQMSGVATEFTQLLNHIELVINDIFTAIQAAFDEMSYLTQLKEFALQLKQFETQVKQLLPIDEIQSVVRSVQQIQDSVREIQDFKRDLEATLGDMLQFKELAEQRYRDIARNYRELGGLRTPKQWWDYMSESTARLDRTHQTHQMLRNQEIALMKKLEQDYQRLQEHQRKIPETSGVHEAVQLMNTSLNTMIAQNMDIQRMALAQSMERNEREDMDAAASQALINESWETRSTQIQLNNQDQQQFRELMRANCGPQTRFACQ